MTRSSPRTAAGKVRIIAGRWRGRVLRFPAHAGVRPSPQRVRETLFDWLAPVIEGAKCLDLFAGSGALGFEALSRGAAGAVLVEQDRRLAGGLRVAAEALEAQTAEIVCTDALAFLQGPPRPCDIAFLDPPFDAELLPSACAGLAEGAWLRPGALVYVESSRHAPAFALPSTWQPKKDKIAGDVRYRLFEVA